MSHTYVSWAKDNLALNHADPLKHQVDAVDCLAWLASKPKNDQRFDLIFMDPPTFSNSAKMTGVLDIQKDHAKLIRQAMQRLTNDGLLVFSNNFRRFKLDDEVSAEFAVEEISQSTIDKDFQRNPRIHRCWNIRHPLQAREAGSFYVG
jgi:23S rRNA (guanine2445-N2)-methyltransferase / 23S rRNA (guanine2069-N7)-methyltransferase